MEEVFVDLSREDVGNLIDDARRFIESLAAKIIPSRLEPFGMAWTRPNLLFHQSMRTASHRHIGAVALRSTDTGKPGLNARSKGLKDATYFH